jgi:hypothetical protein
MDIQATTVRHAVQPYNTIGYWFLVSAGDEIHVNVSRLDSRNEEFLVMIHELIEAYLCLNSQISDDEVTKWDKNHPDPLIEPGELEGCPYRDAHLFATKIEKLLADKLKVDWVKYEENLLKLTSTYYNPYKKKDNTDSKNDDTMAL